MCRSDHQRRRAAERHAEAGIVGARSLTNALDPYGYDSSAYGQGGALDLSLDFGFGRRVQAGVDFTMPLAPISGFGDFDQLIRRLRVAPLGVQPRGERSERERAIGEHVDGMGGGTPTRRQRWMPMFERQCKLGDEPVAAERLDRLAITRAAW